MKDDMSSGSRASDASLTRPVSASPNEAHDHWDIALAWVPWISVDERLPSDEWVLVHNGKWTGVGRYVADRDEELERWQDETSVCIEMLGHKVTHWMPLPPAPSGVSPASAESSEQPTRTHPDAEAK